MPTRRMRRPAPAKRVRYHGQYVDARELAEFGAHLPDRGFQAAHVAAAGKRLQSVRGGEHGAHGSGRLTVTVVPALRTPATS
jgi:hypothetical protein